MNKIIITIIAFSFLSFNTLGFSAELSFKVNPETLREQLLSKNISLLESLNNVQNAKLKINLARAKLLPSLNLGILLPALGNPTFLLSSVSVLFPFLIPSNWMALKQNKELFEADKASYKVVELNILSNALSLYFTFLNDSKVYDAYMKQSTTMGDLYKNLKIQSDILGNISHEDLAMASAQWLESKLRLSKLQELLIAEKASLRTLLGLPLGTVLIVEEADLGSSEFETKSSSEIAEHSLMVAPEVTQLSYLVKAAEAGKFSKLFGFLSSASASGSGSSSSSPFDNLKATGGFTFGLDNLVNIKISNNNIEALKLRGVQLKEENEKMAEIIVGQIGEVKEQAELAALVLKDRLTVYEGQRRQYEVGIIPLQSLLQNQLLLTDSYVLNIKSDLDLKMQRLTLSRLVVEGDFSKIKGCVASSHPQTL